MSACNYNASATCDDGSCLQLDACGECGGSGILGCTDMSACNYNALATCDDGSCLQLDACGECGGNGVLGCTDVTACNYNALATCDDGFCEYTAQYSIEGNLTPIVFENASYTYQNTPGSTYLWSFEEGVIASGQGTSEVSVVCGTTGTVSICVQETTSAGCVAEVACINLVVLPTSIHEVPTPNFSIYPNPANEHITLQCDPALIGQEYVVYDVVGRVVMKGRIAHTAEILDINRWRAGAYVVNVGTKSVSVVKS
jgi:hypothetical protein